MAERRMFSKIVIDSDLFLDLPLSTQALYFHLSMRADDDGFIDGYKKIVRMIGSSNDEVKILFAKGFLLAFENGLIVIRHWKVHNYIQKDRHKQTIHTDEFKRLNISSNSVYEMDTECTQYVSILDRQVRLGKVSIDKDSLAEVTLADEPPKKTAFKIPNQQEIKDYFFELGFSGMEADKYFDYYSANGWMVGKSKMKDWKAAVRNWTRNIKKSEPEKPLLEYQKNKESYNGYL